ncbi:MAG: carbohydrate kinase [Treponema sp.]|jgi:fructokinase|nr:carbohydrate kinase [Treponema sp.]
MMILICGEALIDMVPMTVSDGRPEVFSPCPGGSPYNTAVAAGRLGAPVSFLSRLSKDFFGEILVKRLVQNKVGIDMVARSEQNTTLAFVKLEPGKEPRYIFYTAGAADRSFSQDDLPAVLPAEIDCVVFGSIAMTMEPAASTIEALILRERNRVISFDPNIRPVMIHDKDAYIKRYEKWAAASTIVKISGADIDFIYPGLDLEGAARKILEMGPRIVVCTLGTGGATALLRRDSGSPVRADAPIVDLPVVDTIGAGDTFHGALLSYLELRGKMSASALASLTQGELHDALYFANKAASLVCSRQGAEPPYLAEVEALS